MAKGMYSNVDYDNLPVFEALPPPLAPVRPYASIKALWNGETVEAEGALVRKADDQTLRYGVMYVAQRNGVDLRVGFVDHLPEHGCWVYAQDFKMYPFNRSEVVVVEFAE